jgi:hypothetical protein
LDNTTPLTVLGALNHPFQWTLLMFYAFSGNSLPGVLYDEAAQRISKRQPMAKRSPVSKHFAFSIGAILLPWRQLTKPAA